MAPDSQSPAMASSSFAHIERILSVLHHRKRMVQPFSIFIDQGEKMVARIRGNGDLVDVLSGCDVVFIQMPEDRRRWIPVGDFENHFPAPAVELDRDVKFAVSIMTNKAHDPCSGKIHGDIRIGSEGRKGTIVRMLLSV